MYQTKNDLPPDNRDKLVSLLNARLADGVDLASQAKQAHWNVKGPYFFALHELFDKVHETVSGFVDQLAERAASLGGIAEGTARVAARRSNLPPYPLDIVQGPDHVEALSLGIAEFGRLARAAIQDAEEVSDAATADLFTEVARGVDQLLWFVEAHAQAER